MALKGVAASAHSPLRIGFLEVVACEENNPTSFRSQHLPFVQAGEPEAAVNVLMDPVIDRSRPGEDCRIVKGNVQISTPQRVNSHLTPANVRQRHDKGTSAISSLGYFPFYSSGAQGVLVDDPALPALPKGILATILRTNQGKVYLSQNGRTIPILYAPPADNGGEDPGGSVPGFFLRSQYPDRGVRSRFQNLDESGIGDGALGAVVIIRMDDHPADFLSRIFTNPLVPVVPQKNGNIARIVYYTIIVDEAVGSGKNPVWGDQASGTGALESAPDFVQLHPNHERPLSRGNFLPADDWMAITGDGSILRNVGRDHRWNAADIWTLGGMGPAYDRAHPAAVSTHLEDSESFLVRKNQISGWIEEHPSAHCVAQQIEQIGEQRQCSVRLKPIDVSGIISKVQSPLRVEC